MSEPARQHVTTIKDQPVASLGQAASLMEVISRAASDPNTDVDKLERLLGMYERITAQQAKAAFTAALAELQPRLPVIEQRGKTDKAAYAKWEDINDAIRPILHEYGLALTFRIARHDASVAITGVLSHADGHSEETTLDLPVDTGPGRNAVQAVGSSVSYGKRYTALALLNITSRLPGDADDDGREAGNSRRMSEVARKAMEEINEANDAASLVLWKKNKASGLQKMLSAAEWQEVVRLWNRRAAAMAHTDDADAR